MDQRTERHELAVQLALCGQRESVKPCKDADTFPLAGSFHPTAQPLLTVIWTLDHSSIHASFDSCASLISSRSLPQLEHWFLMIEPKQTSATACPPHRATLTVSHPSTQSCSPTHLASSPCTPPDPCSAAPHPPRPQASASPPTWVSTHYADRPS